MLKKIFDQNLFTKSLVDILGLKRESQLAGRFRANQVRTMIGVTPLMMLANVANSIILLVFLYGQPMTTLLPLWTLAICLMAALGYMQWHKSRNKPPVQTVSHAGLMKIAKNCTIMGVMWGVGIAALYPGLDQSGRILLIAITGGMMGGGAMSLYVIPRAMLGWVLGISGGCAVGLTLSGSMLDFGVAALLMCYMLTLVKAGVTLSTKYGESVLKGYELKEKSETIGVLLKDFSESASDWLWQVNNHGQFTMGMDGFAKHLGIDIQAACPISSTNGLATDTIDESRIKGFQNIWSKFNKLENFHDLVISTSDGTAQKWVSISGKPIFDAEDKFIGYRGVASNITEAKLAEERIAYLAHNDALTGLVNRPHFSQAINRQLESRRSSDDWAVMFLDLDGFKLVNDSKGHGVGDALLIDVATRLKKTLGSHDVVARLGGDEFAVLCTSAASVEATASIAEKLISVIAAPYTLQGDTVISGIGVSIGIAIGKKDGKSEQELLHNADLALYRSKSEGKGTYRFFEIEMDEVVKERRSLEQDLSEALHRNQLSVSFQPLVSAEDRRTEGFEALVRWNHPTRGSISPTDFIPLAESMGIISDIGDWVLHEACAQASNWPSNLTVAVNLSPQQFLQNRIVNSVNSAIAKTGLDPKRLELEITEGLFIDNTEEVTGVLRELKEIGVSIALDDFGTGYSSLSYLLKFPFDKLKIDRSFISSIDEDAVARNVLEAIAKLGNVLKLKVTAEGVETLDQVEALKNLDCTHFQGYLFGKPLASKDMAAFMLNEVSLSMARAEASELAKVSNGDEDKASKAS